MAEYRASQSALVRIHEGGEVAIDYIQLHESSGERKFITASGMGLEVTVIGGFTCLHLAGECADAAICPRHYCSKLQ
jgi:hypothetical protein